MLHQRFPTTVKEATGAGGVLPVAALTQGKTLAWLTKSIISCVKGKIDRRGFHWT